MTVTVAIIACFIHGEKIPGKITVLVPIMRVRRNISTEICRLRKIKLQCFPFFYKKFRNFLNSMRKFPEQHGKIVLAKDFHFGVQK